MRGWIPKLAFTLLVVWFSADSSMTSTAGPGSTTLTNSPSTAGQGSTALTDSPSTAGPGSTALTDSPSTAGPGSTTLTNSTSTAGPGSATLTNSTSTAGPGSTTLTDSPSTAGPGSTTLTNSTSTAGPVSSAKSSSTTTPATSTTTSSATTKPVPGPPTEVVVSPQTTSVTLTVTLPTNCSGCDSLIVSYSPTGDTAMTTSNQRCNQPSCDIEELTAGTCYRFTVYTQGSNGNSTTGLNTTGCTRPSAPHDVEISSQTTVSVTLTVTLLDSGYDGFLVKYNNLNKSYENITADDDTSGSHTLIVNKLTPGTTYTFLVYTLYNGLTSTNHTANIGSTVPTPPGKVAVDTQTTTNVTLDIMLPSTGGVDSYNVTFTNKNGKTETRRTQTNDTLYTVDRLTPEYNYTFTVVSVYKGLTSTPYQGVLASTVPSSSPSEVRVSNRTTTSVTLTVTPGPGSHDGYRVQTVGGDINRTDTFPHYTSAGLLLVSGLTPGTTFTFTVFTLANGLESKYFYRTQDSTMPSAPDNVEITSQTNVSVTLTIAPHDNGYDGFLVKYNNLNQSFQNITADDDTSGSHNLIVNELTPGTTYTFEVYTLYNDSTSTNHTGDSGNTVPNPPGRVAVDTQTTSTVTLDITSPSTGGVDSYNVTFTDKDNKTETRRTQDIDKSYTVKGLASGYSYNFTVVSVYQGLASTPYQRVPASTVPAVPTKAGCSTTNNSIIVTLNSSSPGKVDNYIASEDCVSSGNSISPAVTVSGQTVTIGGLSPGTTCNLTVIAVFGGYNSSAAVFPGLRTDEARPGRVGDLAAQTLSATAISLTWKKPTEPNGDIIQYSIYVTVPEGKCVQHVQLVWTVDSIAPQDNDSCNATRKGTFIRDQSDFNETINDLLAYTRYTFRVYAYTGAGGGLVSPQAANTREAAPGPVTDYKVTPEEDITKVRTVKITCDLPKESDRNGVITNYILEWGYSSSALERNSSVKCSWNISVEPQQNYTFTVSASTSVGRGTSTSKTKDILPGAPLIAQDNKMMIKVESSSAVGDPEKQFRIDFDTALVCNTVNGNIENHYVFVSESTETTANDAGTPFHGTKVKFDKRLKIYQTWSAVEDADKINPYVASRSWNPCTTGQSSRRRRGTAPQTVMFIVGEGGDCSGDCNGYVQPGKSYRVRVASCTAGGCSESEWSAAVKTEPNLVPSIVGGVVGALIAVAIFLAVMFVLRRRSLLCFRTDKESGFTELSGKTNIGYRGDSTEMVVVKARKIKVSEFAEKFYELSKDSNMKFSEEVKLLKEISPVHKTSCAEEQAVRIKNRYTNILAFDHSRVKLLPLDEEDGSDYINANYIPGHNSKREYIAAQGPLVCTKDDFWRMIWEQNVSVIVMLTQLVERGRRKCDQYWPEVVSEPFYFGDLIVRIDSESNLPDYVIRVISLQLNNRKKKMKQVHYLKWPDMGCPDTSWLLLNFVQDVRLFMPHQNPGPIVVHCSAGVGRTGTFIAVDHLIQKLNAGHQEVDIFNMVLGMRNERPNMVQTEDQYIFIHECIKDFLSSDEDEEEEEEDEEDEDNCEPIYENA